MQSRVLSEVEHDYKRRFVAWKKNALGQLESYTDYDATTGVLQRRIDINGLVYTQTADAFGRKRTETAPDGNETRSYQKVCDASCPAGAVAISITDHIKGGQRSALPSLVYSDSAGHVLRTQSWGFDGRVVTADAAYDARGRVFETYWPRLAGAASVLASRTTYDDLNRVTSTVTINDGGAAIASGTEYKGLQTVLTNANGQSKTDTRDVRGKLWKSVDAAGTTYYAHDPYGNLFQTSDPAGNVITVGYDALGRRTGLADPDLGSIQYDVDALGRTWRQVSPLQRAASTATTMTYDLLDRMVKRTEPDLISYWDYELMAGQSDCQALKSCGKLVDAHTMDLTGKVDYRRQHSFDQFGRPDTTATYLDKVYYVSSSYDNWGRPLTQTLSRQGGATKQYTQHYNARGYVERIDRGAAPLWWATAQDASNRVTNAALGNGMTIARDYNPYTGHLSFSGLNNAQNQGQLSESYNYDALGNVKQRAQYWPDAGFTEGFDYDGLNRLSSATVAGQPIQWFRYNAIGNLLAKTGVGNGEYVYPQPGSARPHAVQAIPGIGDFYYDGNGNLLAGAGRTIGWTSFDMPRSISKGADNSVFMYGPEHQRARQQRSDGMATYYAGAMETEINNGAVTIKTYWPMGLGVEIDKPDGTTELNWTHLDRLGSVVGISDESGNLKERLAYDSWGKRRTINGEATPDSLDGVTDNRGFTGHEMLDKLDLVHMNGRVYDPLVARFISADPIIQDPEHSQSYNRYTYVWNNPTNLTDPTGFAANVPFDRDQQIADQLRQARQGADPHGWRVSSVGDGNKPSNSKAGEGGKGAIEPKSTIFANNESTSRQTAEFNTNDLDAMNQASGEAIRRMWGGVADWATAKQNETGNWLYAIAGTLGTVLSDEKTVGELGAGLAIIGSLKGGGKLGVPSKEFVPSGIVAGKYSRPSSAGPTAEQRASVQGKPCVECGVLSKNQVADHKDPLIVQHYREGKVNIEQQRSVNAVQPHCQSCSAQQGGYLSAFSRSMRKFFGF